MPPPVRNVKRLRLPSFSHHMHFQAPSRGPSTRTSRPKNSFAIALPGEPRCDATDRQYAKHEQLYHTMRGYLPQRTVVPISAVFSILALGFFACGLVMARNLGSYTVISMGMTKRAEGQRARGTTHISSSVERGVEGIGNVMVYGKGFGGAGSELESGARKEREEEAKSEGSPADAEQAVKESAPSLDKVDVGKEDGLLKDEGEGEDVHVALNYTLGVDRSWPVSVRHDAANLIPLHNHLQFTNRTLLNYFHMHKTGGVTTKVEVMNLVEADENKVLMTKRGQRLKFQETCYLTDDNRGQVKHSESMWRCDFGRISNMTSEEKSTIDILLGHQYWEGGCEDTFGQRRSVKHFSIFRHPLPRKLSFFYHFFVRNVGKDEKTVSKDEVINFLLNVGIPNDPRARDSGPNYYASRMLSDGLSGFRNHQYLVAKENRDVVLSAVLDRLENRFAFVGLQVQPEASQCMLRKTVEVLAHVHGIDNMKGTSKLAESRTRLNSGQYTWTSRKIWDAMSMEQRQRYKEVEKVDLAIYSAAVKRFKTDVGVYSCSDRVVAENWESDIYE